MLGDQVELTSTNRTRGSQRGSADSFLCFPLLCFLRSNFEVWESKNNFPRAFLSSSERADEKEKTRGKVQNFLGPHVPGATEGPLGPEIYEPVWTWGHGQQARGSEGEQASQGRASARTRSRRPAGRVLQRGSCRPPACRLSAHCDAEPMLPSLQQVFLSEFL